MATKTMGTDDDAFDGFEEPDLGSLLWEGQERAGDAIEKRERYARRLERDRLEVL